MARSFPCKCLSHVLLGFPDGSVVKNPPANAGNAVRSLGEGVEYPQEEEMQPIPIFLPGKSYELRSLAGYSPWGHTRVGCD